MKSPSHAIVLGCTLSTGLILVDAGLDPGLTSLSMCSLTLSALWSHALPTSGQRSYPNYWRFCKGHFLLLCPGHLLRFSLSSHVPAPPTRPIPRLGHFWCQAVFPRLLLQLVPSGVWTGTPYPQVLIPPCPSTLAGHTNTNWPSGCAHREF